MWDLFASYSQCPPRFYQDFTLLTAAEDLIKDARIRMGCEANGVCHE